MLSLSNLPLEVLRLILQDCPNSSLYVLVVGSSHTFELAVPVLWSNLWNLQPLINLIPEVGSKDLDKVMARWNHYASLVKCINVGPTSLTARQYRILLCAANKFPILPKLVRLAMRPQDWPSVYLETINKDPTHEARFEQMKPFPANWTHAMHFVMLAMGPALQVLEIAYTGATIPNYKIVFMRAPCLSSISFTPTVQDYDYEICNNSLYFDDEPSLKQQKQLGYSHPGTLRVEGPPGTAEYNPIHIVHIPGSLKVLSHFERVEEMSFHGGYIRGVNFINIGQLPRLRSLTLRALKSDSQSPSQWGKYSSHTDPQLFPLLRNLLLLEAEPRAAFLIFSADFMLHQLYHITWETSEGIIVRETRDSYFEALERLSQRALSLTSLSLTLSPSTDSSEHEECTRVQNMVTELWPGSTSQQVVGTWQICISNLG